MNERQLLYELTNGIPLDITISKSLGLDLSSAHDLRKSYEGHVREAKKRGIKPISSLHEYVGLTVQASRIYTEPCKDACELMQKYVKLNRVHGKLLGIIPPVKQCD